MRVYVLRGGYYPHGGAGLLGTFMHSLVGSFGWHTGIALFHMLGSWAVLIGVIALVWFGFRALRRRVR